MTFVPEVPRVRLQSIGELVRNHAPKRLTWARLVQLEPRLSHLLREARAVHRRVRSLPLIGGYVELARDCGRWQNETAAIRLRFERAAGKIQKRARS